MESYYGQLTEAERCEIFRLRAEGISQSEIARVIGRNKRTISRELRRNALPKAGLRRLPQSDSSGARRIETGSRFALCRIS
jgi:IS30 family transposase